MLYFLYIVFFRDMLECCIFLGIVLGTCRNVVFLMYCLLRDMQECCISYILFVEGHPGMLYFVWYCVMMDM